jgi:hypothetical protein
MSGARLPALLDIFSSLTDLFYSPGLDSRSIYSCVPVAGQVDLLRLERLSPCHRPRHQVLDRYLDPIHLHLLPPRHFTHASRRPRLACDCPISPRDPRPHYHLRLPSDDQAFLIRLRRPRLHLDRLSPHLPHCRWNLRLCPPVRTEKQAGRGTRWGTASSCRTLSWGTDERSEEWTRLARSVLHQSWICIRRSVYFPLRYPPSLTFSSLYRRGLRWIIRLRSSLPQAPRSSVGHRRRARHDRLRPVPHQGRQS